jgi:hypothetical protein
MPEAGVSVLVDNRVSAKSLRYQGPLTSRSRTVTAMWLSAGKAMA